MFTLLYDRTHRVLRAHFTGILGSEDLAARDAALIHFLSEVERPETIPLIDDYHELQVTAAPRSLLEERAAQPPIVQALHIVVAPPYALESFGEVLRRRQRENFGATVEIVHSLDEAYRLLKLDRTFFRPVQDG